ncbi:MAG: DUF1350 family protein [Cyanobacteria bacterium P01_E01_bin.6]
MNWQEIAGNWVLVPRQPKAIIHFLGGAFIAAAPHVTYRWILESLAQQGYLIIATSFVNTFDHGAIARQTLLSFEQALDCVRQQVRQRYLPIYGLGHSMGCKVHLLICSLFEEERAGNIFISFNNYPARRSVPLLDQFSQLSTVFEGARQSIPLFDQIVPGATNMTIEFTPSPDETTEIVANEYRVKRNLLIKFMRDDIDQTYSLHEVLYDRFPKMTAIQILRGNHLTPLGQDIQWQPGQTFSPLDAVGQFMKQELYRDLNHLQQHILMWLNPTSGAIPENPS